MNLYPLEASSRSDYHEWVVGRRVAAQIIYAEAMPKKSAGCGWHLIQLENTVYCYEQNPLTPRGFRG